MISSKSGLKLIGLVFLLVSMSALCQAQDHAPSSRPLTIVPIYDGFKSISLGKKVEIAEDKRASIPFEEVISAQKQKLIFTQCNQNVPHFRYTDSAIWLRTTLRNAAHERLSLLLEVGYPLLDEVDLYLQVNNGNWNHTASGDTKPFDTRPVDYRNVTFPINLEPEQSATLYLRVKSRSSVQVPLTLWKQTAFISSKNFEQIAYGALFGLLIVMVIYNLILYFPTNELSYFFYFTYIGNGVFFLSSITGHAFQYLWPKWVWWHNQSVPFFILIWIFTSTLFTRTFLRLKKYAAGLDRVMQWMLYSSFALMIPSLIFDLQTMTRITVFYCIVAALLTLSCGFVAWKRGFFAARFFVLAWVFFSIGVCFYALKSLGYMESTLLTQQSMNIGTALETVLIALALGDYIYTLREEREQAVQSEVHEQQLRLDKVTDITFMAENLANVADKMSESMQWLSRSSPEVVSAVMEANSTVQRIEMTAKTMDESAKQIAEESDHHADDWQRGYDAMLDTGKAIEKIQTESSRIADMTHALFSKLEEMDNVINQVRTVTDQSKVLAVNASIEASNAGEEGRGFGVIAKEINALAQESALATADVTGLLEAVRESLKEIVVASKTGKEEAAGSVNAIEGAKVIIGDLANGIRKNAEQAGEIADAISDQTTGLNQILTTTMRINETATENLNAIDRMMQASQSVRDSSGRLRLLVEKWND